jgi:hypothetical protein
MKNADSHIILYAKGWYKRANCEDDLKAILAHRNECEKEHISRESIIIVLTQIVYPYLTEHYFREISIRTFSKFHQNLYKMNEFEMFLKELLSILSALQIKDDNKILIELDEPDYNILSEHE